MRAIPANKKKKSSKEHRASVKRKSKPQFEPDGPGEKLEHLVQASDFKNGPEIFLHGCERKFPAVVLCVLHAVDQNG